MAEMFDPRIIEEGPVTIRRNETEENMEFAITDYHANRYPVADKGELRSIRTAINNVLKIYGEEVSQAGDFKTIDAKEPRRYILTDLNESVLFGFNKEDIPQIIETLEEIHD